MKTLQKLEICAGIATPIATLLYIYFGFVRFVLQATDFRWRLFGEGITSVEIGAGILFAFILLFSLMVAVGAYYHAQGSRMAIDALYIGGLVVIVFLGFWGFFVLIWGGILYGLLAYSPVILSAITIILAQQSKEKTCHTV
jgi:hypothetical protein